MTTAPSQRKLVLNDKPRVILATIETARQSIPGHDEDDIVALIEEGFLPCAWNIALDPRVMARELRILPACIEHYAATNGSHPFPDVRSSLSNLLKLPDQPFIRANLVRLVLNCSSTHLINLIDAKLLKQVAGTQYRRGPNGDAILDTASLIKFLDSRQEGQ